MQFFPIHQISVYGVVKPGVPNQERLVFRPTQRLNLTELLIGVGVVTTANNVYPVMDYLFYFDDKWIDPPCWVMLFTGPGENRESLAARTGETIHVFHWNLQSTVFNTAEIIPIVFHIDSIALGVQVAEAAAVSHKPRASLPSTKNRPPYK